MQPLKLQVFFEKQDKKIKEEAKKALPLKSAARRVSVNEVKEQKKSGEEQILIRTLEHLKTGEGFQNEDLNSTSLKPLSQEEKENLVKRVEGCSTRATEKLLSEADPSLSLPKEGVRFLGKGKVEIKMVIDEQCYKELEKLKNLLSHRNPKLSYGELISILSKEAVKKHDPGEKNTRHRKEEKVQENPSVKNQEFKDKSAGLAVTFALRLRQKDEILKHLEALSGKPVASARKQISPTIKLLASTNKSAGLATSARKSEPINQYSKEKATFTKPRRQIKKISPSIPSHLRKYIWERDAGQCTYVHYETKRRCASRHLLQIDHIQPFALGGRTEKENLRLLCAGHNQYRR